MVKPEHSIMNSKQEKNCHEIASHNKIGIIITFHMCSHFFPDQLLGNDSRQNFEDLKVNLSDVEVLSSETQRSLSNLSNSGVDDINFDAFLNEVMLSPSSRDVSLIVCVPFLIRSSYCLFCYILILSRRT